MSVQVSVEVPLENLVQEIAYDGQEILQAPLSMSESLTRLAHRIDFTGKGEDGGDGSPMDTDELGNECTFKTTPVWPWDTVRNKMRSALTELSVLGDILQIAAQKKYLVLDPVQADPPDIKPAATLMYKKRGLAAASVVLSSGAERLRNALNEARSRSSMASVPDFHIELLKLRQNWRLRKVGNTILGDLSYRTAGSRFGQPGIFEVIKAEDEEIIVEDLEDPQPRIPSALRVVVPKELQGIAYIQVLIQKDQEVLSIANIGLMSPGSVQVNAQWQQRLEAAQNVLFCRELFSVLAREAVQLDTMPIPSLVVGNQISSTIFPGILLIICLCHGSSSKGSSTYSGTQSPKLDENQVLEHSLHQLLREVHRKNSCVPLPHPCTAPIGISRKRRLAGPIAYDRQTLLEMTKREGILEEMIHQAQHVVLRLRTMHVIDTMAREIKDPLLISHWASLNSVTHSCVRLNLLSSGYDMTTRTPLVIHIREKSLKCILKDGKAIHLSYEPQELRDIIMSQIASHQIIALQSLAKCMGWSVLSASVHLGVGLCENLGNGAGCLMSSPNGKRNMSVRSSPQGSQGGIEIFVGGSPKGSESFLQTQNGVCNEGSTYRKIDLSSLDGKNFLNKMEMLMAVIADADTSCI